MKKFFIKIFSQIEIFFINLIGATKNTETQLLTQAGVDTAVGGITIGQDAKEGTHALSKALLRGELTEDVKQLRYRNYMVDREAKKYKYYAPTLALKKKEGKDNKFISYDKSDGLEVITIQNAHAIGETVGDGLQQIENGGRGEAAKYNIEIKRDFTPRFKIEEFMEKLVVKRFDETHAVLDFYFSKYPDRFFLNNNDKAFRTKPFIHEIENIRDNKVKSDILDIDSVRFVTFHAYKQDDLKEFLFNNVFFNEVAEFDGDYILRFKAVIQLEGFDLTKSFYNEEMDRKYKNHEKRDTVLDLSGKVPVETYICADCGKEVTFDVEKIDEMPIAEAREIDEEVNDDDSWNATEYFDMQIVEQTIGKKLCKKCLQKYIDKRGLE